MSPSMARTTIISGATKNRCVACGGGRRLEEYRKADPAWEIVLDLDQLAGVEKENWVWKGADILRPSHDRALLFLSRGGADAAVTREFDLGKKEFVATGSLSRRRKAGWLGAIAMRSTSAPISVRDR